MVFTIAGATYSILERNGGKLTLGDIGDYWYEKFNPKEYDSLNRDGKYRIYDPITLDLNGDGIQALAANGFAGALFDHDNDGIRTATGWVNKEDGLLVRDLNGNGIIDNGRELFGDNTRLADGSLAAHGYLLLLGCTG